MAKVFVCYSHKDEGWKDRLVEQLGVLEKEGRSGVVADICLRTWVQNKMGKIAGAARKHIGRNSGYFPKSRIRLSSVFSCNYRR